MKTQVISEYSDELDKSLKRFKSPLHALDSIAATYGCRHSNPDGCLKCNTSICAFAREDKRCLCPPKSWQKKFKEMENGCKRQ